MGGSGKLSKAARSEIEQADSVYVSAASLWEIGIKVGLDKLDVDICELVSSLAEAGFVQLPELETHSGCPRASASSSRSVRPHARRAGDQRTAAADDARCAADQVRRSCAGGLIATSVGLRAAMPSVAGRARCGSQAPPPAWPKRAVRAVEDRVRVAAFQQRFAQDGRGVVGRQVCRYANPAEIAYGRPQGGLLRIQASTSLVARAPTGVSGREGA